MDRDDVQDNQTRVTKISKLEERLAIDVESCLVQIHGPDLGKRYVLEDDEFTIGRDVKNNIVVDLDNVSRRHAKIAHPHRASTSSSDLGSTNGTYLNDEEVAEEKPLRNGDLVKVGGTIFKFLSGAGGQRSRRSTTRRSTASPSSTASPRSTTSATSSSSSSARWAAATATAGRSRW